MIKENLGKDVALATNADRYSETQDQRQSVVYSSKLIGIKAPGGMAEALRIDHRSLLDEDPGFGPVE